MALKINARFAATTNTVGAVATMIPADFQGRIGYQNVHYYISALISAASASTLAALYALVLMALIPFAGSMEIPTFASHSGSLNIQRTCT